VFPNEKSLVVNPSLNRCLAKSVANWKELSSISLDILKNFLATKANEKEPNAPKIFVHAGVSF